MLLWIKSYLILSYLKMSANMLLPFYTNLFNTVFETGEIPESWTTGVIIPIYKKGDPTNPSNYRGITLLSTLGKVFTKLIYNRLEQFTEIFGILKVKPSRVKKNNSTIDQLFVIHTLVDIFLKQNRRVYVAWIDYAKAFDMVWRSALWFKLTKSGVSSKIVNVIKQIYGNIKSKSKSRSIFILLSEFRWCKARGKLIALFVKLAMSSTTY